MELILRRRLFLLMLELDEEDGIEGRDVSEVEGDSFLLSEAMSLKLEILKEGSTRFE